MRSQAVSLKKPWISVPKKICDNYSKVIKKSVLICDNLWTTKTSVDEKTSVNKKTSVDKKEICG